MLSMVVFETLVFQNENGTIPTCDPEVDMLAIVKKKLHSGFKLNDQGLFTAD